MNPLEEGPSYGLDAIRDNIEHWKGAWEELEVTAEEFIDAGDRVLVTLHHRGRGRGSGIEVDARFYELDAVSAGKVVRVDEYAERSEALEAAGLSEWARAHHPAVGGRETHAARPFPAEPVCASAGAGPFPIRYVRADGDGDAGREAGRPSEGRQAPMGTGGEGGVQREDGEHVYIGPIDGTVQRYRLGAQVQQFLHGEFDELPAGGLEVWLLAPGAGQDN